MKKEEQQRIAQDLVDRHGNQAAKDIAAEIYRLCFRFIPEPEPTPPAFPELGLGQTTPSAPTRPLGSDPTEAQRLAAMMLRAGVELVTPMQPPTHYSTAHLWQRLPSQHLSSQNWPSPLRSSPQWQSVSQPSYR